MKCPLANKWWFGSSRYADIDNYNLGGLNWVTAPYSFFYGKIGGSMPVAAPMRRVGDSFTASASTAAGKRFRILAADYLFKTSETTLHATHQSPDGVGTPTEGLFNGLPASFWFNYGGTNAHFALDDGSVTKFSSIGVYADMSGGDFYRSKWGNERHILPKSLAE